MSTVTFEDIKSRRLAGNWNVLNDLIDNKGFPSGHIIGRRRIWTEREILAWIEAQPTEKMELRGAAREASSQIGNLLMRCVAFPPSLSRS